MSAPEHAGLPVLTRSALRDETTARVAWSRLAEPGDVMSAGLIREFGVLPALEMVLDALDAAPPPDDGDGRGSRVERYRARARGLDVDRDLEVARRLGLRLLVPGGPGWPAAVDDLAEPPVCLWVRGDLDLAAVSPRSVAIVGARASTSYGDRVAADLAADLSDRRWAVVSGAAFGIDAAAHRGALAAGGDTIAVLAGAAERAYPVAHTQLIDRIAETGAVISEVPPGSAPTRSRFLQRNRLIAALTRGTVVVEAGLRSGALSTLRHAEKLARPWAAVPGPVTSMVSAGCHEAIRRGAVCVTDAAEVVDLLGTVGADLAPEKVGAAVPTDDLPAHVRAVAEAMPLSKAVTVDRLCAVAGQDAATVMAALSTLELRGLVQRVDGGWSRRRRSRA